MPSTRQITLNWISSTNLKIIFGISDPTLCSILIVSYFCRQILENNKQTKTFVLEASQHHLTCSCLHEWMKRQKWTFLITLRKRPVERKSPTPNRLIRSLNLVRVRLTKQLLVFARRIVVVERNWGRRFQLVRQLNGRVAWRVVYGRSGQKNGGFSNAVCSCCRHTNTVDSVFNSHSADQGTVPFSPSHYVENLQRNIQDWFEASFSDWGGFHKG